MSERRVKVQTGSKRSFAPINNLALLLFVQIKSNRNFGSNVHPAFRKKICLDPYLAKKGGMEWEKAKLPGEIILDIYTFLLNVLYLRNAE